MTLDHIVSYRLTNNNPQYLLYRMTRGRQSTAQQGLGAPLQGTGAPKQDPVANLFSMFHGLAEQYVAAQIPKL